MAMAERKRVTLQGVLAEKRRFDHRLELVSVLGVDLLQQAGNLLEKQLGTLQGMVSTSS